MSLAKILSDFRIPLHLMMTAFTGLCLLICGAVLIFWAGPQEKASFYQHNATQAYAAARALKGSGNDRVPALLENAGENILAALSYQPFNADLWAQAQQIYTAKARTAPGIEGLKRAQHIERIHNLLRPSDRPDPDPFALHENTVGLFMLAAALFSGVLFIVWSVLYSGPAGSDKHFVPGKLRLSSQHLGKQEIYERLGRLTSFSYIIILAGFAGWFISGWAISLNPFLPASVEGLYTRISDFGRLAGTALHPERQDAFLINLGFVLLPFYFFACGIFAGLRARWAFPVIVIVFPFLLIMLTGAAVFEGPASERVYSYIFMMPGAHGLGAGWGSGPLVGQMHAIWPENMSCMLVRSIETGAWGTLFVYLTGGALLLVFAEKIWAAGKSRTIGIAGLCLLAVMTAADYFLTCHTYMLIMFWLSAWLLCGVLYARALCGYGQDFRVRLL